MAVATAATIKTQLDGGSYPDDTLTSDLIFDYQQFEKRRRYPSCEIVTIQPESREETKDSTFFTSAYEIRYYTKRLGAGTDEVSTTKLVEDEIIARIELIVLQDHKITFESKIWSRKTEQRSRTHPAFITSILKVLVRQITPTTAIRDGILKFILSGSTVQNPPAGDFTYTSAVNVDIQHGYRDIVEPVTQDFDSIHFTGDLTGRFICEIIVKAVDMGTTGEKVNKLGTIDANGNRPLLQFEYTNKTGDDPTASTITETINLLPESIQRIYRTKDTVVFRLIANIINEPTITVT